jgi:hypothetical protein
MHQVQARPAVQMCGIVGTELAVFLSEKRQKHPLDATSRWTG